MDPSTNGINKLSPFDW